MLTRLAGLEAEAGGHRIKLDDLNDQIEATKIQLNGIRTDLLDEFLAEYLEPKLITYIINTAPNGEIQLNLSPMAGGELAFDRLKSQLGWQDMSTVPLFYVLAYLGVGTPWTTTELNAYVQ